MVNKRELQLIEKYLDEICSESNYKKYEKEFLKIWNLPNPEWSVRVNALKNKYNIMYASDVYNNNEEYSKFKDWCKNKKRNIEL